MNKNPSATKRGPGRYHKQRHSKASPPSPRGKRPTRRW